MSTARRRLVTRPAANEASSQAPHRSRQPASLPPYEPPTCPLTAQAREKLMALNVTHDSAKYKKHLKNSLDTITTSAVDATDRLVDAREKLRRHVERRTQRAEGGEDEEGDGEGGGRKTEAEVRAEQRVAMLEERVPALTVESEKALREIIDYADELARQDGVLEGVVRQAAEASLRANEARRQRQRQRRRAENSDDEDAEGDVDADGDVEMMDPEVAILSPLELLNAAKEEDKTAYEARTMRSRYAENNDYINFKRLLHDSQHPGAEAPPVPAASTWFPSLATPSSSRRRTNNADQNGNESDDDLIIAGEVSSLKCPLTLRTFVEPYSNNICRHTFEKSAILEMHHMSAVAFQAPGQRRGHGPKKLQCPQAGCNAMLELKDFYDDALVLRQVKRAEAAERAEREADSDDEGVVDVPSQSGRVKTKREPVKTERIVKTERAPRGTQVTNIVDTDDEDEDDATEIVPATQY